MNFKIIDQTDFLIWLDFMEEHGYSRYELITEIEHSHASSDYPVEEVESLSDESNIHGDGFGCGRGILGCLIPFAGGGGRGDSEDGNPNRGRCGDSYDMY